MIIEFVDPGYNWLPVVITGSILIALLIAAVIVNIVWGVKGFPHYRSRLEAWTAGLWLAVVVYGLMGFGIGGAINGEYEYRGRLVEAKAAALADAGFENVELSGDEFTASDDGEYFRGQLIEVDSSDGVYTYQVVELVEVEG